MDIGAQKFIEAVRRLNASMEIPDTLKEIAPADIPDLAANAAKEGNPLYPVPRLMNAEELMPIYHRIARGE